MGNCCLKINKKRKQFTKFQFSLSILGNSLHGPVSACLDVRERATCARGTPRALAARSQQYGWFIRPGLRNRSFVCTRYSHHFVRRLTRFYITVLLMHIIYIVDTFFEHQSVYFNFICLVFGHFIHTGFMIDLLIVAVLITFMC